MSAYLRQHCPAGVISEAGRVGQWTLPVRLAATNDALGAPLLAIVAEMPIFQALRVGGLSWDGTSHGLAGGGQERQTQKRSDQQDDTLGGHRGNVAEEGVGEGRRELGQRARAMILRAFRGAAP